MLFSCAASVLSVVTAASAAGSTITFPSTGNPIIADGSLYSADPAPIVVNGTLYVISGQDSAPPDVDAFIMNDWVLFSNEHPNPAGGNWTLHHDFEEPHKLFSWAAPGSSYASQIVHGPDGRFYMYAPVQQANFTTIDPFGIGVAVSDNIAGPYKDIHPSGPIVSESYPAPGNNIQNIDPTVLVDDDGKVYMYWGTFGQLRGVQLKSDMKTFASSVLEVNSLDGFFEAAWLMKRKGVYYLIYADNDVSPTSKCTPTVYHACLAYGTATSPLGPWEYRGVILGIVSSTTSHSGAVAIGDQWYLVYHTADAKGGGNFRRSIAYDYLNFDDTKSPPLIKPISPTLRAQPLSGPTKDRGQFANVTGEPEVGVQYWIEAVHDLETPADPLPPEYWSTYNGAQSAVLSNLTYTWPTPVTLSGTSVAFFADHPAGAVEGVAPPATWIVQYLQSSGEWAHVKNQTQYPLNVTTTPKTVPFAKITTTALRAIFTASTNGTFTAGVGVLEWRAFSSDANGAPFGDPIQNCLFGGYNTTTSDGSLWSICPKADFQGVTLQAQSQVASLAQCIGQCSAEKSCLRAVYDSKNRECFFKNGTSSQWVASASFDTIQLVK